MHVGYVDINIHMISWILDISISFLGIFWGGGAQKFKFTPGRQLPSLRHCIVIMKEYHNIYNPALNFTYFIVT